MIIRHSLMLLEQLSEVEQRIKEIEKIMDQMGIKGDREKLIATILARRSDKSSDQ